MKIAFATSNGVHIDGSFRTARDFSIWDVTDQGAYYVTSAAVTAGGSAEGRIAARAAALHGCTILCTRQIDGPAAAALVGRGICTLRIAEGTGVEEVITRLQGVLCGAPPPWLRKALARDREAAGAGEDDPLMEATVADLLSRHPQTRELVSGAGLALFEDEASLNDRGVMLSLRDATMHRGISPDLFRCLLEQHLQGRRSSAPAP